jgi:excisionase family DNA binding protein
LLGPAIHAALRAAIRDVLRIELPAALAAAASPAIAAVDDGRLLDVEAAAARLKIAVSTLYKLAASMEVPHVKLGSRTLFRVGDLDAYVARHLRSPERVAGMVAAATRG